MLAALKKRKAVRTIFTKTYDKFIEEIDCENPDREVVKTKFTTVERLAADLQNLDDTVITAMLEDENANFEAEYSTCEEYREKIDRARVKMENFNEANQVGLQFVPVNVPQSNASSPSAEKRKLRLPKIELKTFSGNIKDFLSFWSQFKRIHEDEEMKNEDKFQYLIQATVEGSRAREIVDSFPATAENYEKAVESLRNRFGREELLTEYYVRELLSLVIKKAAGGENRNVHDVSRLYDNLEAHLRALESIGISSDKYAAMLFPLVESSIPEDILKIWLRNQPTVCEGGEEGNQGYGGRLKYLMQFLRKEVENGERISLARAGFKLSEEKVQRNRKREKPLDEVPATAIDLLSCEYKNNRIGCIFCDKSHESKECFQAQRWSLEKKRDILKRKKGCFICLKSGHRAKDCKHKVSCIVCYKTHHTIVCPQLEAKQKQVSEEITDKMQNVSLSNQSTSEVILQTLLVNLEINGKVRTVRALIDTGSQRSYILKKTAEEMGGIAVDLESVIHALFGGGSTKRMEHKRYNIKLRSLAGDFSCKIEVLDQPLICGGIARPKGGAWIEELKARGVYLTDVGVGQPPVEVLLGADVLGKLYTGTVKELQCGLTAVETRLGWVVMGKFNTETESTTHATMLTTLLTHTYQLSDLWNLDVLGITDPCEKQTNEEMETAVRNHFKETVRRHSDGRYEVKFPWINDTEELPDNRGMAEKRLISTTSKLCANGKLQCYDEVLQTWLMEGITQVVPEDELQRPGHYLPHRGVFKENSTTSIRPVFDASSKVKGSPSLNDCLAKGPNLLDLIPSILLKFRQGKIGVISDIKKAFLQISVHDKDRDFLRFLWWENLDEKRIRVMRHCRVVFGVNCSPFLLSAVIQHHLDQCKPHQTEVAKKLSSSFYVDNCVTSVDSEEELKSFVEQATEIMAEGKFELRGWENTTILPSEEDSRPAQVLGLLWDKNEDKLFCNVDGLSKPEGIITRRTILSMAHRVYDPIGFSSPVTLFPKLLLQKSWKAKLSWDSELAEDLKSEFLRWVEELPILNNVRIPRWTLLTRADSCSLHIFCDASKLSYATVVFLRCESAQKVRVSLLQAKSRVAPLRSMTIPRLELLACVIGVRLAMQVKKGLNVTDLKEYYWTDSTTALHWITVDSQWGTFVKNRVKEICTHSNPSDWSHIPGQENPADLPSRGCNTRKLLESRWWEGPNWLKLSEEEWPKSGSAINQEEVNQERRKGDVLLLTTTSCSKVAWYLKYFSTYTKILRMVAWMRRFINNARKKTVAGELSVMELDAAEINLMRVVQQESFVSGKKSPLNKFCVLKDSEGVLRLKTQVIRRQDEENFRYPMILPNDHKLVERIIEDQHLRANHAGLNVVLSTLRERFWILKGRKTVRKVLSRCVRCKRHEARRIHGSPAPLPEDRVRDADTFEVTGVDLTGPLRLKDGSKCWIVLFTCAVYRAIHLELTTSLSTKSFLDALRRFIARRGRPKVVYSDNGSNFVGANNSFQCIDWRKIEVEASIRKIQWMFNPPTAAWWGGWWERLIQMVKKLLRRVLGFASLHYEEMSTILCDCEATVNSRPLTYIAEDPDNPVPLTPAMFLHDITDAGVPDLDHLDQVDISKRYQYLQRLREELRMKFRSEYLSQLIQRRQGKGKEREALRVGDVVLLESETKKRTFWPMARVTETYPGKDGCIRVVKLKTARGEMVRPVQRVYPLEVTESAEILMKEEAVPDQQLARRGEYTTRCGRRIKVPRRLLD